MMTLQNKPNQNLSFGSLIAVVSLAFSSLSSNAAVVLQDGFDNGTAAPTSTSVGNWVYGTGISEANSKVTVTTTSPSNSSSTNLRIDNNAAINPFTSTVTVSVREFSLFGTGNYQAASAGRFRIGLVSDNGSFFGTPSGVALEIANNGLSFALGLKVASTSNDPSRTTASGTFTAAIAGFDFAITSTSWALTLYDASNNILYNSTGAWNLGSASAWGTNGSSSLLLAAQNTNPTAETPLSGGKTFEIGSLTMDVTAIPEPGKAALLGLAGIAFILRRKRRC